MVNLLLLIAPMDSMEIIFTKSRFRVGWHLLYWSVVLIYYTLYFGHQGGYYWFTFQFVVYLLPVAMGTTYLFNYYLIPRFLFTKRLFYFFLFATYAFIFSLWLISLIIFPFLIISRDSVNFVTLDKSILDIYFLIAGLYTTILLAVLIKLLKLSYERQHLNLKLLEDKTSAELDMLKSQINPHFLFNTLNSIYTLSLKKSDETPEVVIKLSDMLHYLLYECSAAKVPLDKEILLIENYRHLQQMRFGHRLDTKLSIEGSVKECKIAPMLLLPFVENSFKHGVGKDRNASWIKMNLEVSAKKLTFEISNSISSKYQNEADKFYGGIGLANVRKRLQLIYPEKHQLQLEKLNNKYTAMLKLDL